MIAVYNLSVIAFNEKPDTAEMFIFSHFVYFVTT